MEIKKVGSGGSDGPRIPTDQVKKQSALKSVESKPVDKPSVAPQTQPEVKKKSSSGIVSSSQPPSVFKPPEDKALDVMFSVQSPSISKSAKTEKKEKPVATPPYKPPSEPQWVNNYYTTFNVTNNITTNYSYDYRQWIDVRNTNHTFGINRDVLDLLKKQQALWVWNYTLSLLQERPFWSINLNTPGWGFNSFWYPNQTPYSIMPSGAIDFFT